MNASASLLDKAEVGVLPVLDRFHAHSANQERDALLETPPI